MRHSVWVGLLAATGWLSGLAPASAGPHAYGVLVPHLNPTIEFSYTSGVDYQGFSDLRDCEDAISEGQVLPEQAQVWFVLASFADSPGPVDLGGVDFGLGSFDGGRIAFAAYGPCNDGYLEIPDDGWPGPNRGTALIFDIDDIPHRSELEEIYWFATYVYAEVLVPFSVNPTTDMGVFGSQDIPPQTDEIWDFGEMGFGRSGYNPCAPFILTGACCLGEECQITTRDECEAREGRYKGDNRPCFPNPCREETVETSWGRLKDIYR